MTIINWDEVDALPMPTNLPYCAHGKYTVTVDKAEVKTLGTTPAVVISFQDGKEERYPKTVPYWISIKKDVNVVYRARQMRQLAIAMGKSKKDAQEAVDFCEGAENNDLMVKSYRALFEKLSSTHPKVEIETRTQQTNPDYDESTLTAEGCYQSARKAENKTEAKATEEMISEAEPVDIGDVPF